MISAFGIDHGISKSLKPQHLAVLERAAKGVRPKGVPRTPANKLKITRQQKYAQNRLAMRDSNAVNGRGSLRTSTKREMRYAAAGRGGQGQNWLPKRVLP